MTFCFRNCFGQARPFCCPYRRKKYVQSPIGTSGTRDNAMGQSTTCCVCPILSGCQATSKLCFCFSSMGEHDTDRWFQEKKISSSAQNRIQHRDGCRVDTSCLLELHAQVGSYLPTILTDPIREIWLPWFTGYD